MRIFREAGSRHSLLTAAFYGAAYVLSLLLSIHATDNNHVQLIWTANGVLLAAVLQLDGQVAKPLFAICFGLNLLASLWIDVPLTEAAIFAAMNALEIAVIAVLTRVLCGTGLDLRRPMRLARFIGLAVVPTCFILSSVGILLTHELDGDFGAHLLIWFLSDVSGILTITPAFLMLAGEHRFERLAVRSPFEQAACLVLLTACTALAFGQSAISVPFLVFIPLGLIAYRLSPKFGAMAILIVAAIAGGATLNSQGPFADTELIPNGWGGTPLVGSMPAYYLYMLAVVLFTLISSTIWSEQRRLESRLRARTAVARNSRDRAVKAEQHLRSIALHDGETGLLNRAGLDDVLSRWQGPHWVAAFSVDRFASIRAAIGINQMSLLIERCAERIADACPEFVIGRVMPDTLTVVSGKPMDVEAVLDKFAVPLLVTATPIDVRFSVGLAGAGLPSTAIHRALVAVEKSRVSGDIASFEHADEMRATAGLTMLSDLRAVNDRGIGTPYFRVKGTPCLGAEKGTPGSARSGEAGRGCTA